MAIYARSISLMRDVLLIVAKERHHFPTDLSFWLLLLFSSKSAIFGPCSQTGAQEVINVARWIPQLWRKHHNKSTLTKGRIFGQYETNREREWNLQSIRRFFFFKSVINIVVFFLPGATTLCIFCNKVFPKVGVLWTKIAQILDRIFVQDKENVIFVIPSWSMSIPQCNGQVWPLWFHFYGN